MTVKHLTILAVVEVRPGATVEFGCEVAHVNGRYRSRGTQPTWGRASTSIQEAVNDEALRVYKSTQKNGKAMVDCGSTTKH